MYFKGFMSNTTNYLTKFDTFKPLRFELLEDSKFHSSDEIQSFRFDKCQMAKKNIIGVFRTVIFRTKSIYSKKNPFNRVERVNKIIKIKNII